MTLMFLNGGGMRGGPVHHLLRGAPLVAFVRTAPRYRLYSVADRFPAMAATAPGETGVAITGELYDVPMTVLRDSLLPGEPPELELGVIELDDGSAALGMVRRRGLNGIDTAGIDTDVPLTDISHHADWRAYLAARAAEQSPGSADTADSTDATPVEGATA